MFVGDSFFSYLFFDGCIEFDFVFRNVNMFCSFLKCYCMYIKMKNLFEYFFVYVIFINIC